MQISKRLTWRPPGVRAGRAYALEVNAHRSNRETVTILTSLLTTALRPEPAYRLPVPMLLVHGDRDRIGDIATGTRAWAEGEPLAEYAVIPRAGHGAISTTRRVHAVLQAFLDRATRPLEVVGRSRVSAIGSGTSPGDHLAGAGFVPAVAA